MAEITVKERTEDVNDFIFTGRIVMKNESQRALSLTFRTDVKREGEARSHSTPMTVLVFDPELRRKVLSISIQDKVRLTGYTRSSKPQYDEYGRYQAPASRAAFERKKENDRAKAEEEGRHISPWDEPRYRAGQYFVATGAEAVPSDTPDTNEIHVLGSIEDTFVTTGGQIRFLVRTHGNYLSFFVYPKDGVDYLPLMRRKARIKIDGFCRTRAINTNSGIVYEETCTIENIEKA